MGFHHVALATRDLRATHQFYSEVMGFELQKTVVAPTDAPDGWAKHVFYDTGDGLIAFWELHDERMADFDPAISTGLGLEAWVNHLAFAAADLDDLAARREQWLDAGHDAFEIDHGWCVSIYTMDPNGILVEWCTSTTEFTDDDRARALEALFADDAEMEAPPDPVFHPARRPAGVPS